MAASEPDLLSHQPDHSHRTSSKKVITRIFSVEVASWTFSVEETTRTFSVEMTTMTSSVEKFQLQCLTVPLPPPPVLVWGVERGCRGRLVTTPSPLPSPCTGKGGASISEESVTTTAIFVVDREEKKQEQLSNSCSTTYNINQVWADSSRRVITWARADSITIMFVQPGTEYKLYKVLGAHQERDFVLTHSTGQGKKDDKPCKIMPARTCQMCDKGYSTVFSLEYKVEKNMYQVSFQQCHVYANVNLQIGEVNKMDRKRMCTKAIYVD